MTGETLLLPDNVTGGANTRLLTIAAPKIILPADTCKEIRSIIKENYGLVFPLVIDKVFEIGFDNLRKWYNEIVDSFTKAYPDLLNDYCRYMAIITLADFLLNSVLDNQNVLDDAIIAAKSIFSLIPTTSEISDTARERDFVLALLLRIRADLSVATFLLTGCRRFTANLMTPIISTSRQKHCKTLVLPLDSITVSSLMI